MSCALLALWGAVALGVAALVLGVCDLVRDPGRRRDRGDRPGRRQR